MLKTFPSSHVELYRVWNTIAPKLEILLCRESSLPLWENVTPSLFAAPFARIYWNEGESMTLKLSSGTHMLPEKCFCVIGPDVAYVPHCENPTRLKHFFIHVSLHWPWQLKSDIWNLSQEMNEQGPRLLKLLRENKTSVGEGLLSHSLAHQVFAALPSKVWLAVKEDTVIEQLIQKLVTQLHDHPTNVVLAKAIGLTPDGLIRRFQRITGMTPKAFILKYRLSRAAELLSHTDRSIDAIAEETRFFDRYHLTKSFSAYRGVSPGLWRRYMRGKEIGKK